MILKHIAQTLTYIFLFQNPPPPPAVQCVVTPANRLQDGIENKEVLPKNHQSKSPQKRFISGVPPQKSHMPTKRGMSPAKPKSQSKVRKFQQVVLQIEETKHKHQ